MNQSLHRIKKKFQIKTAKEILSRFYKHLGKIRKINCIKVGLSAYEGLCFFVETFDGGRYILKCSRNFWNYKELDYLFRIVKVSRRGGFDEIINIIATDKEKAGVIDAGGRSFVLYEFKEGEIGDDFDYQKMGRFLALFHNAVSNFKGEDPRAERKKIVNIKKQTDFLEEAFRRGAINLEDYNHILEYIGIFRNNFSRMNRGLKKTIIHGDFNGRNVLKNNKKIIGLVDFDDLHMDLRILDFSRVILHNPAVENLVDFVKEYQKFAGEKLNTYEILALPEIWRFRLIKMLIWAVSSPEEKTIREISKKERDQFNKAVKKNYFIRLKMMERFDDFDWPSFYKALGIKPSEISSIKKPKIIATIGRASNDKEIMEKMALAGMDVARLNFSYETHAKHQNILNDLRRVGKKIGKRILILQDLGGTKLRIGDLENDEVKLVSGQNLILARRKMTGNAGEMSVNQFGILKNVRPGVVILLEGKKHLIELKVISVTGGEIKTRIIKGGSVRKRKGLHVPGIKLNLPVITEKDREDLQFGIKNNVDWVALSFVQSAETVKEARKILDKARAPHIKIVAKVENIPGIKNIDEIIKFSDMVMVARGDMSIEVPKKKIPIFQKMIVGKCRKAGKPVIVATGFLESMIEKKYPEKSEIEDVRRAAGQGSDYLLLSPETAKGKYPVETIATMRRFL